MARIRSRGLPHFAAVTLMLLCALARADAPPLVLLIQPLPTEEGGAKTYTPLARYIATLAGRPCVIEMPPTFPAYWETVRHRQYDLAFDGPPFTDYRIKKLGFKVLVKTPAMVSYSLVVRASQPPMPPNRLAGKRIASLGLLSIGALRLNAIFPNAVRQPLLINTPNTKTALTLLFANKVEAAFLPTHSIADAVLEKRVAVVLTAEPIPHLALSASASLDAETNAAIRNGLLNADQTDTGRRLLHALALEHFEPASAADFENQRNVLKRYWGY